MMRAIVPYDDITLPYDLTSNAMDEASKVSTTNGIPAKGPARKRKRKSRQSGNNARGHGRNASSSYAGDEEEQYLEADESRELTHEEVWDDSALIDAWNAATEEYEAINGPDKGWKHDPVHKSPLWYNVPPAKKQKQTHAETPSVNVGPSTISLANASQPDAGNEDEADSQPIDFDTFVPAHDAGLDLPEPSAFTGPDFSKLYSSLAESTGPMVSQDEAFNRAVGAMYWSGYWTAVYHCHRRMKNKRSNSGLEGDEEDDVGENGDDDEGSFVDGTGYENQEEENISEDGAEIAISNSASNPTEDVR